MSLRKMFILLSLATIWASAAFAGTPRDTAMTDALMDQFVMNVAKWSKEYYSERPIEAYRVESRGDVVTPFNTVIAQDCLEGKSSLEREIFIHAMTDALAHTIMQLFNCTYVFMNPDPAQAIPVLRQTRISCSLRKRVPQASRLTQAVSITWRKHDEHKFLFWGSFLASPAYDHSYEILIPEEMIAVSGEDFIATLGHEIMHLTRNNNRSWHNNWQFLARPRLEYGCQDSLFEDRIYFWTAACFPRFYSAENGYKYDPLSFMGNCPGVCRQALGGPDKALIEEEKYVRRSLIAKAHTYMEIEQTCSRIEQYGKFRNSGSFGEGYQDFERLQQSHRIRGNVFIH